MAAIRALLPIVLLIVMGCFFAPVWPFQHSLPGAVVGGGVAAAVIGAFLAGYRFGGRPEIAVKKWHILLLVLGVVGSAVILCLLLGYPFGGSAISILAIVAAVCINLLPYALAFLTGKNCAEAARTEYHTNRLEQ